MTSFLTRKHYHEIILQAISYNKKNFHDLRQTKPNLDHFPPSVKQVSMTLLIGEKFQINPKNYDI